MFVARLFWGNNLYIGECTLSLLHLQGPGKMMFSIQFTKKIKKLFSRKKLFGSQNREKLFGEMK
jgi:hypothetical protein